MENIERRVRREVRAMTRREVPQRYQRFGISALMARAAPGQRRFSPKKV